VLLTDCRSESEGLAGGLVAVFAADEANQWIRAFFSPLFINSNHQHNTLFSSASCRCDLELWIAAKHQEIRAMSRNPSLIVEL
jgi:hypothetical protein